MIRAVFSFFAICLYYFWLILSYLFLITIAMALVGGMLILAIPLLDLFLEVFMGRPNPHDAPWWIYIVCLVLLPLVAWLLVKVQDLLGLS